MMSSRRWADPSWRSSWASVIARWREAHNFWAEFIYACAFLWFVRDIGLTITITIRSAFRTEPNRCMSRLNESLQSLKWILHGCHLILHSTRVSKRIVVDLRRRACAFESCSRPEQSTYLSERLWILYWTRRSSNAARPAFCWHIWLRLVWSKRSRQSIGRFQFFTNISHRAFNSVHSIVPFVNAVHRKMAGWLVKKI